MRQTRSGLGAAERARMTAAATANLAALPEVRAALTRRGCVAGFAATQGEIDPGDALTAARVSGARVAYPRVSAAAEGGDHPGAGARSRLRFHLAAPEQLRAGAFGIDEPPETSPEVSASDVDVMIVPGLAFDPRGRRVGYGGGYYDQLLGTPGGRPRFVVGFGYDFQVVDACPAGGGDVAVDCVVTDVRVIRCPASPEGGAGGRGGVAP